MKIERIEKIANNMKDIDGKVSANKSVERLNTMSFWELLSETSKIQIPIIQRDFAQGRENEKTNKIRYLFLKNIIEAVESENGSLELDFVYGNVENDVFQPLDGQQRLTTLFLLHWYIALKTGNLLNSKNNFLKFTYETRISSREFCNELVDKGMDLGEGKSISEKISDSNWFFLSWKKDPTIKAMLVMLDAIEELLKSKNDEELNIFWQKLTSENPPITFYFKQLNDVGLTDDLYIKMNARGKALTDFENFKARFEKYISEGNQEKINWENDLVGNPMETFSHKIDTIWTDLFWKHRGEDNIIDNEMIKFIAGIAINNYAQNLEIFENSEDEQNTRKILEEKKEKNITDEAVTRERVERRISSLFNNPEDVSPCDFPTKESFEYLKNCFDIYADKEQKYDELIPNKLPLWDFVDSKKVRINSNAELENNLFIEFTKDAKTEYKQRVLFYAQTQYLLNCKSLNTELFSEWMRVVRNTVQNSTIDSATTFIGAIGLIKELSSGSQNIYNYLSQNKVQSIFASNQVNEEVVKAKILDSNITSKQVIYHTEDANFFKGKIEFALYCIDYDIDKSEKDFNIDQLNKTYSVINTCFHELTNKLSDDFKRAFLTIRNNDYYNVWGSWSWSFDCHKRWLLDNVADLHSFSRNKDWKRDYLKDLVVYLVDKGTFLQIVEDFIKTEQFLSLPNWKQRLIKNGSLLKGATFILIPNDNSYCKLAWQQKPSREDQVKKIK